MSDLRIKTCVLGAVSTNCYLVYNEATREAVAEMCIRDRDWVEDAGGNNLGFDVVHLENLCDFADQIDAWHGNVIKAS